jgi:hypothetical protein
VSFTIGHVSGGTNAGCKRPLAEPRKDWDCPHGHRNRGYAIRCLTSGCGEKRPK